MKKVYIKRNEWHERVEEYKRDNCNHIYAPIKSDRTKKCLKCDNKIKE